MLELIHTNELNDAELRPLLKVENHLSSLMPRCLDAHDSEEDDVEDTLESIIYSLNKIKLFCYITAIKFPKKKIGMQIYSRLVVVFLILNPLVGLGIYIARLKDVTQYGGQFGLISLSLNFLGISQVAIFLLIAKHLVSEKMEKKVGSS